MFNHQQNPPSSNPKYGNDPQQTKWLLMTKKGDRLAFNNIVKKYQQPIYNFCYRMLKNKDEAEDAAQEIFMRAYAKLDTYNHKHKFSTWLFSIASHYCIDSLRKQHFQLVSWDDLAPWYPFPGQDTPQPEKQLLETETIQEVQSLLDGLPPDYRTVIILKYWHTQSYQEIAQTLDTSVSAVKSKLFRARKMIAAKTATPQVPPQKTSIQATYLALAGY